MEKEYDGTIYVLDAIYDEHNHCLNAHETHPAEYLKIVARDDADALAQIAKMVADELRSGEYIADGNPDYIPGTARNYTEVKDWRYEVSGVIEDVEGCLSLFGQKRPINRKAV